MTIPCMTCGGKTRTIDSRSHLGPPPYVVRTVACSVCAGRLRTYEFYQGELMTRSTLFEPQEPPCPGT